LTTLNQRSFSGGEIAPSLYARVDTNKYATGLRTCRNFFVMRHGGVSSRPGTKFIGEVSDSSAVVRLIPFIYNSDQTYVLEFGNLYMRVIRNGAQVTETAKNISGATQADPCVVTVTSHGYSNGDEVYITGVEGMTELNGRNFKIANVTTHTFELQTMDGTDLDATGYTAYTSGGTAAKIYEIATPYTTADLPDLKHVQTGDVVTLTHNSYAQRQLARTGHTSWTLSTYTFLPTIDRPNGGSASAGGAGANTYKYRVTAIADETFEESLAGREATQTISGATQANPCVVTVTGHTFNNGDEIYIDNVAGMTELNEGKYLVANTTANTFELTDLDGNNINSTGYTAYSSGGTAARTFINLGSAAAPTTSAPHTVSWTAVSDAQEYNVYKELNGVYGFIGIAGGTSFEDVGTTPDVTDTPPKERNPFSTSDDYPAVATYVQQRLVFANTNNNIEKVDMSRTGQYNNFTTSSPLQNDDAISFTIAGRQVNEVRHLLDLGRLIVFTSGGEWAVEGDSAGIITPFDINLKPYSYHGASTLSPIVIGNNALFVQARGSIVRDLGFDIQIDGYRGNDLTIFSAHLVDGYSISDWAYQQIPHSVVWAVRNDGTLLGLTYVREQQMIAWHRHDFDGTVENVVSVPESGEDAVYLVIKRSINGNTVRYIERMTQRRVDDIVDFIGMDSALTYDGRNTNTSHTMTLSGGTDWDQDETLTITSSSSYFSSSDVGNAIHLTGSDGTIIRFTLTAYTSATEMSGKPHKTVPVGMRSTAISSWSRAVDEISGLWHLEGKEVSVLGDGFVLANPNNSSYVTRTVTNGAISLDNTFAVIHVGLPITCDLETLDIDTFEGETMANKGKITTTMTIYIESSRDLWAGTESLASDNSLSGLVQLKVRNDEDYDSPISLQTGTVEMNVEPRWNKNGRLFIRQTDPVPLNVLAVAPAGMYPVQG